MSKLFRNPLRVLLLFVVVWVASLLLGVDEAAGPFFGLFAVLFVPYLIVWLVWSFSQPSSGQVRGPIGMGVKIQDQIRAQELRQRMQNNAFHNRENLRNRQR